MKINPKVGDRVEIKAMPWNGRTGFLRKKLRFGFWEIWCDDPDAFGRKLVRTTKRGFVITDNNNE